jgi:hypothetical protein
MCTRGLVTAAARVAQVVLEPLVGHAPSVGASRLCGSARCGAMRSLRLISTATATVFLLGAGTAHADAPWSNPAAITSDVSAFNSPALAFTGDGHALASLGVSGAGPPGLTRILAAKPGTTTFTETGRTVLVAGPATYGRRGVAFLGIPQLARGESIDDAGVTRLGATLGSLPGSPGRFQRLARVALYTRDLPARIAADPRGNVAAAWIEPRGGRPPAIGRRGGWLVRVALRRPGHAFGRPQTVAVASAYTTMPPLDLAYGANGDLVVAFQRSRAKLLSHKTLELAVRVKRRGRRFGPIQTLGPLQGSSSIATVVAPTGRAVVAWGTQDAGEGVEEPWAVRAAVLRPGARAFSKRQLLDPGAVAWPLGPVRAAIGSDGTAAVAWSGTSRSTAPVTYPVHVATARPTGRFGAAAQLAPNGEMLDVVTAGDGTTTVLWGPSTEPEGVLDGIFASRRPPGGSDFAAPEAVTRGTTFHAAIALDPRTGRPAVLWIGELDGRPVLRYSTRGG